MQISTWAYGQYPPKDGEKDKEKTKNGKTRQILPSTWPSFFFIIIIYYFGFQMFLLAFRKTLYQKNKVF